MQEFFSSFDYVGNTLGLDPLIENKDIFPNCDSRTRTVFDPIMFKTSQGYHFEMTKESNRFYKEFGIWVYKFKSTNDKKYTQKIIFLEILFAKPNYTQKIISPSQITEKSCISLDQDFIYGYNERKN